MNQIIDRSTLPIRRIQPFSNPANSRKRTSQAPSSSNAAPRVPDQAHIPRAASYTYFEQIKEPVLEEGNLIGVKGTVSEEDLEISEDGSEEDLSIRLSRAKPRTSLNQSRQDGKSSTTSLRPSDDVARLPPAKLTDSPSALEPTEDPLGEKLSVKQPNKLRRKSWVNIAKDAASRSPSPVKRLAKREDTIPEGEATSTTWSFGVGRRKSMTPSEKDSTKTTSDSEQMPSFATRRNSFLGRASRSGNVKTKSSTVDGTTADASLLRPTSPNSLPKSFSTEVLSSGSHAPPPVGLFTPLPRQRSTENLNKGAKLEKLRRKDELWSAFRTLDGDFQKFTSKSMALKANVVRASLLPFLRSYTNHQANLHLRPEDLDRRINILNKWWLGLLDMLSTRNQSLSGTDRPIVLEAISGIVERPEWRLHPSPFCPLDERIPCSPDSPSASSASIDSEDSDFLEQSVQHNIRNVFTQNLLTQMAFVVEKMSLRNAPASLVSFCGKTCAYAFFFCPGVADVLVRLWDVSADSMRRVSAEGDTLRGNAMQEVSKRICAQFPPAVRSLGFLSFAQTYRELKILAKPPLGSENVAWDGPWINRWTGKESDLFYVFVKHYHALVSDFIPAITSKTEKICIPGLVLVHAQILANLDSTIHRHDHATLDQHGNGPAAITFDDVLGGDPDAAAPALPLAPMANSMRLMYENRLVMLLRDFLSDRSSTNLVARQLFAESFHSILKSAARRTSIFDHNACYTLCDFLEEALVILMRYDSSGAVETPIVDWPFWLNVCKQMVKSHNTTTEIRLYAFLYSVWGTLILEQNRQSDLCMQLLLDDEFFHSRFNHWCPMVRAYYMRLLCWRVARHDGEESEAELAIYTQLNKLLRTVWSHFVYSREEAVANQALQPSTAPCNPAPGRRLLIIRTDPNITASKNSFLSFDSLADRNPAGQSSAMTRLSGIVPDIRPTSAQSSSSDDDAVEEAGKKKWGLFKSIINTSKARGKSQSPSRSPRNSTEKIPRSMPKDDPQPPPNHRAFSFKFSLEWVDRRFNAPGNMRLQPPRLPLPAQYLLQVSGEVTDGPSNFKAFLNGDQVMDRPKGVKPEGAVAVSSKYAGRALAEWALVVNECQNFFERRKGEGVPSNKLVETPTLGVEAFKKVPG